MGAEGEVWVARGDPIVRPCRWELRVKHGWLVETPLSSTVDGGAEGETWVARWRPYCQTLVSRGAEGETWGGSVETPLPRNVEVL